MGPKVPKLFNDTVYITLKPSYFRYLFTISKPSEYSENSIAIKVGDTLFRLPKDLFLVPGTLFPAQIPNQDQNTGPGITDAEPIRLLDVTEEQFHAFLLIVHPK